MRRPLDLLRSPHTYFCYPRSPANPMKLLSHVGSSSPNHLDSNASLIIRNRRAILKRAMGLPNQDIPQPLLPITLLPRAMVQHLHRKGGMLPRPVTEPHLLRPVTEPHLLRPDTEPQLLRLDTEPQLLSSPPTVPGVSPATRPRRSHPCTRPSLSSTTHRHPLSSSSRCWFVCGGGSAVACVV